MITDEQAEKAADYIRDHAEEYAQAKSDRIHIEQYRKSKKAILMNEKTGEAEHVRSSYAYAHHEYISLLDGLKAAIENEEKIKWLMESARLKIEIWRTESVGARNVDRSHR